MTISCILYGLKRTKYRQIHLKQKELDCCICFEKISSDQYTSKCGHCFCEVCILKWLASEYILGKSSRTCPLCRGDIKEDILTFKYELGTHNFNNFVKQLFAFSIQHDNVNYWIVVKFS